MGLSSVCFCNLGKSSVAPVTWGQECLEEDVKIAGECMGIVETQDFEKEPIRAGSRIGIEGSLSPGFCDEGFSHVYLYAWVQSGSIPFICMI